MSVSKKMMVVASKLSVYERRNLHSMGAETFVTLADMDPTDWKYQLSSGAFATKAYALGTVNRKLCGMRLLVDRMQIRDKVLLDIYHFKSHIDKSTRSKAGKIYKKWHPSAIMPPML